MEQNLKQAIKKRRTYYSLSNQSTLSDQQIQSLIEHAVLHVPTAFNSQSGRVVLLLGENHKKLWNIVKDVLKNMLSSDDFSKSEEKINGAFASGYGTVLFFEDQDVVQGLQMSYPSYSENFPIWSEQASGMLQFAIWTMLDDAGMAASLQHYNPLIDNQVQSSWNIPTNWKLIAQMPFGVANGEAGQKEFADLESRVLIFK